MGIDIIRHYINMCVKSYLFYLIILQNDNTASVNPISGCLSNSIFPVLQDVSFISYAVHVGLKVFYLLKVFIYNFHTAKIYLKKCFASRGSLILCYADIITLPYGVGGQTQHLTKTFLTYLYHYSKCFDARVI